MLQRVSQDMLVIGDVLVRPGRGFERLASRPAWGTLFLVAFLLNGAFTAVIYPYVGDAALAQVTSQSATVAADVKAQDTVRHFARLGQLVGLALTPVTYIAKWALVAMLFWSLLVLAGFEAKFRALMAMVAHANLATLAAGLLGTVIVVLHRGAIVTIADLHARLGLDAFWSVQSAVGNAILALISPFEAWYIALLAVGLSAAAGVRRRVAVAMALLLWASAGAMYVATVVFSDQLSRM